MQRSDIHFPPKHEPLRDDVHALGALIGEILRDGDIVVIYGQPEELERAEAVLLAG